MTCAVTLDKPGAPSQPEATNNTENSIGLNWDPPVKDGGKPVTGYLVEKREKGEPRWTKAFMSQVCKLGVCPIKTNVRKVNETVKSFSSRCSKSVLF